MTGPAERGGDNLFCQSAKWVQKAWDNSSLSLFKTCPRKYQLAIIEGWSPRGQKGTLEFGSLYHKGLEVYDKARVQGHTHQQAQRTMIHKVLDHWARVNVIYEDNLIATVPYVRNGTIVLPPDLNPEHVTLVHYNVPWDTGEDNRRTKQTLIRSLVWYTDQFEHDAAKTVVAADGQPAVELSFRLELPITNPDGDPYFWCGHIDKLVTFGGFKYILERKHTATTLSGRYFDRFSPNSQVSGYSLAVDIILNEHVAGTIVDAAQVAVGFTRFQRGIAPRTKAIKEEWLTATLHWIERAEQCAKAGYWPMNEESCSNYGGCQFRGVCAKDPGARKAYLETEFVKEPWNPLENRE